MNVNNPYGGFLVLKDRKSDLLLKVDLLLQKGAETIVIDQAGIVFAAWNEFPGQGLWESKAHGAVAYDTELSNETQLRQMLELEPSDPVDTGKLLWLLYKAYGREMLDKLRGSFCFSLWDHAEKILLVATDPFGLRPVVFKKTSVSFAAASRIKHLLWANHGNKQINTDAIYHYLFFHAVCSPLTIYQDFHKLEPGNAIEIKNDQIHNFIYYDIKYQIDSSKSEADWILEIQKELEKAVNTFATSLPQDKTGCFLSGGTDSSSIVAFYTKLLNKPVHTFSIGFDEKGYNETYYADMAAQEYQTLKNTYYITPEDVLSLINTLPDIYDEPFGNASVIPAFFCGKLAKDSGMQYLLGGDGGDEVFGGNERYVTNLVFKKYFSLPEGVRKSFFEPLLSMMPSIGIFHRAKRYVRRSNILNPERFYSYNLLAENDLSEVFNKDALNSINSDSFMEIARRHYNNVSYTHETNRLLYLDMKFTITDNDIRKVTQMVEAAGTRVRYPFLDRDLVDFTATIPAELKAKWGKTRYIFKEAMKGILPDEIINKTKHGMGLPIDPWFKKDPGLKEFLADHLIGGNPKILQFVNKEFINRMYQLHKESETPYYGDNLWVFLQLELWLNKHQETL